jgi:predicted nucleotidyltransferase
VKKKSTIYIDEALLRAAKVRAVETGRKEHEIVEAALRQFLNTDGAPTLDDLRRRRDELLQIARSHGARDVRVFGSVARGEARPDSDVDFLVELEPGRSLLDLSGLILDLEEALGREVDVVEITKPSRAANRIRQEAVPL